MSHETGQNLNIQETPRGTMDASCHLHTMFPAVLNKNAPKLSEKKFEFGY